MTCSLARSSGCSPCRSGHLAYRDRTDVYHSSLILTRSSITLRSVLKDLSTVHGVAGRVSAKRIALRTAGNMGVCFTSSIIPSELSSGICFCMSYHARASSTRLSMPYISLTDEMICLNSSRSVCCICFGCSVKIWRVTFTKATFPRLDPGIHVRDIDGAAIVLLNGTSYIRPVDLACASPRHGQVYAKFFCQGFHLRDDIFCKHMVCIIPVSSESLHQQVDVISDSHHVHVDCL